MILDGGPKINHICSSVPSCRQCGFHPPWSGPTHRRCGCMQALHQVILIFSFRFSMPSSRELLPVKKKVSYEHIAKFFYDFFACPLLRKCFYERVVKNAKKGPRLRAWESFEKLENGLKRRCSNWLTTGCPLLLSDDKIQVLYNRKEDIGSNISLHCLWLC